jgi:hypothetical protein
LDSKLTFRKHLTTKLAKSKRLIEGSSPTLSLEVLYNLKPLELVMENIALRTHMRLTQGPNRAKLWEGIGKNTRNGRLRHWNTKLEQYNINTTVDKDKIIQVKVWNIV